MVDLFTSKLIVVLKLLRFSAKHFFCKPNDKRALSLMNKSAEFIMNTFTDIIISYGQSDEYRCVYCL